MIQKLLLLLFISLDCLAQRNLDSTFATQVDSMYAKYMKEDGPGGSLFVQCGDRVIYQHSFGLADLKTREKFTDRTVANLGSISKTIRGIRRTETMGRWKTLTGR
jgi:CubicO group peptidase (beta-lactamase class C family)